MNIGKILPLLLSAALLFAACKEEAKEQFKEQARSVFLEVPAAIPNYVEDTAQVVAADSVAIVANSVTETVNSGMPYYHPGVEKPGIIFSDLDFERARSGGDSLVKLPDYNGFEVVAFSGGDSVPYVFCVVKEKGIDIKSCLQVESSFLLKIP